MTYLIKNNDIDPDLLRRLLIYDEETGIIKWRKTGKLAGSKCSNEYLSIQVTIDGARRRMLAHRIVFVIQTGNWPEAVVDHRNGIRDDNRWKNLRPATHLENKQNEKIYTRNTSGEAGVSWDKSRNKWTAHIHVNGKTRRARFDTFEKAVEARREWKRIYHPFGAVDPF